MTVLKQLRSIWLTSGAVIALATGLVPVAAAWQASGAYELDVALSVLLLSVRDRRAQSALGVTGRIVHRALSYIEK